MAVTPTSGPTPPLTPQGPQKTTSTNVFGRIFEWLRGKLGSDKSTEVFSHFKPLTANQDNEIEARYQAAISQQGPTHPVEGAEKKTANPYDLNYSKPPKSAHSATKPTTEPVTSSVPKETEKRGPIPEKLSSVPFMRRVDPINSLVKSVKGDMATVLENISRLNSLPRGGLTGPRQIYFSSTLENLHKNMENLQSVNAKPFSPPEKAKILKELNSVDEDCKSLPFWAELKHFFE